MRLFKKFQSDPVIKYFKNLKDFQYIFRPKVHFLLLPYFCSSLNSSCTLKTIIGTDAIVDLDPDPDPQPWPFLY
jgi:hypothetical protein